jgi:hypothetical protein
MQQNPYAPPREFGLLPGAMPAPAGAPRGFTTREVIEQAWQITKIHWPVLVAAFVVWTMPASLVSVIPVGALVFELVAPNSLEYWGLYLSTTFASQIIGMFFQAGYIRIALTAARGQAPQFMDIFGGFDRFLSLIAILFITLIPETLGFMLLVVPGMILFLGFSLSSFYCVDANLGPIASLRESWRATRGHRFPIFVFLCAAISIYMLGMLACCVGTFLAIGLIYVAWAIVYIRLSGHEQAALTRGA